MTDDVTTRNARSPLGRCTGRNKDGGACSAQARPGSAWCAWHDPALDGERATWRRKGGEASSNVARAKKKLAGDLRDLAGVKAMLLESMQMTKDGEMEPGVLTALSTAARAVVVVAGVADFEEQLATMRADIARFAERQGAAE
jgi:hypothetical protein